MPRTTRRITLTGIIAGLVGALCAGPMALGMTPTSPSTPTASPTVTASPSPAAPPPATPTPGITTLEPAPSAGAPTPSPEPIEDDHDHETDGPTEPLTRELPPGSPSLEPLSPTSGMSTMRLTVPAYGPQPVFRLPYAPSRRWGVSGSHSDSDGINRGAIDFAPLSSSDKRVLAVASGMVYRVTCGSGWFLGVDHGGGWMSEYYHLTSARSSLVGTWVEAGTPLGNAGQTLPCGGTPGSSAHVHLSILNSAVDVPSGKRKYVAVSGIQFDTFTLRDSSGAYNGSWRNLAGNTVLTSRGVTCCLTASSRVGPAPAAGTAPDTDGDGIDDHTDATVWDTDLDSNGRPDLVAFGSDGVYTSSGTGTGFTSASRATTAFGSATGWSRSHPRMTVDVTGDGRPDVVAFGPAGVYVAAGSPGSFATARVWVASFGTNRGWRVGTHQRTVVDVTGDGRPDVVGFGPQGVFVSRNTGSSFAAPTLWTDTMGSSAAAGGWVESRHPRRVVDVTGDGLPDLVGFGDDGVHVARNTGGGFADPVRWVASFGTAKGWTVGQTPRHVTDIDGDGRPDIVGFGPQGIWVSLNTGSNFAAPRLWSSQFRSSASGAWRADRNARTLADVNGDGRLDVVGFAGSGTLVALGRGSSFAAASSWTAQFDSREWTRGWMPRSVTDVNGDGRADVVGFARDGVQIALSTGSRFRAATHATRSYGWDASSGAWRVARHVRAVAF